MAKLSFSASVAKFAEKVPGAVEAVWKDSAQDVVEEMQTVGWSVASTRHSIDKGEGLGKIKKDGSRGRSKRAFGPVASSGAGGNLPVDTGFLRASLLASTSAMPAINSNARPVEGKTYDWDESQIEAVIQGAGLGQTLYFGYTAAYASHVEYGANGRPPRRFVALAAMNWQQIVNRNAEKVRKAFGL